MGLILIRPLQTHWVCLTRYFTSHPTTIQNCLRYDTLHVHNMWRLRLTGMVGERADMWLTLHPHTRQSETGIKYLK